MTAPRSCAAPARSSNSRKQDVAELITLESGLSLKDTLYEVGRAYDVFILASTLCLQDDGQIFSCDLTPHGKKRRIFTQRDPLRCITAITPFNHPLNQVAHKVAPSIATNNKMMLKPSEKTPLTALLLADVLYEAGLPPEMFSVVTGDPREIADELLTNPNVELITFTGGVSVGKYIAKTHGLSPRRAGAGRQRSPDRHGRCRYRARRRRSPPAAPTRIPASAARRSSA